MLQGCSKKRPDVFFELNRHCVIVEIDEDQYKRYDTARIYNMGHLLKCKHFPSSDIKFLV